MITQYYICADEVSATRVGSSESSPTHIVAWCNGNTTDFGSVITGSSPVATTQQILKAHISKHTIRMFGTAISRNTYSSSFCVCIVLVTND